jgi:RND superfamily putative drug exporter
VGGLVAACLRRPWRALVAALLVLAAAVALLAGGFETSAPGDQLVGDSAAAERIRDDARLGGPPVENVVVSALTGSLAPEQARRLGAELTAAYTGLDGVRAVGAPILALDGRTLLVPVTLDAAPQSLHAPPPGERTADDAVAAMRDATARLASAHPDLRIGQVGPGSIDAEIGEGLAQDFRRAEYISLPVTLGILLVAFGAVVAAGVPVLLGLAAVAAALGLTAFASRTVIPVDQNTQSLVLLIGLAVGVDYALFVVRRSREERAAGASTRESVRIATATAGRAVVISGATVVVAMSGMLVAGGLFTSLAIGAMAVVAIAVLGSVTVLPAILALLGDRIDALRIPRPRLRRRAGVADPTTGVWGRLAGRVARRPLIWTASAAALLVALALPATGMRTALFGAESLPQSFGTVEALGRLTAAFPQRGDTVDVVVRAPAEAKDEVREALAAAAAGMVADPPRGLVPTTGLPDPAQAVTASVDGTVHVLALPLTVSSGDSAVAGVVDAVRERAVPQVRERLGGVDGVDVHVGGSAAVTDLTRWMDGRLPWVIAFVLVLTFAVMLVSFGSVWLAAATVALNLLSVGAAYGVMTLIFQHSWAEGVLDFHSVGAVAAWLPLLMFVILFGLSMDYHVFVVSRVREAWSAGVGAREAVRLGVAGSAGVVTSAAAVMVAVFAVFGTLSSLEMKQLGVGLATAVLLDATVVRGVLLPAVLALLGSRAHRGPRWLPALHH